MINPSPISLETAAQQVDTGPLSWVMAEMREALGRSDAALREAASLDEDTRPTALHYARTHLHQAHGALLFIDIDGLSTITETAEDLIDRIASGKLSLTAEVVQAIGNAYQALIEYLEELLSGMAHQPVRLFPYYRELLQARGAERIHPADLFFPNLAVRPQLPPVAVMPANYAILRQRFERTLLSFLKNQDANTAMTHASAMRDIVRAVEEAQEDPQSRAFWWVMHGFAEMVATGQVAVEVYVKQLFARINLQLRRLAEGSTSIAERLLCDALFFIAQASNPSARVRRIRDAYQLGEAARVDYEARRYGQIDVNALAAAKDRLSRAKGIWNRVAGGDAAAAIAFESEMTELADVCASLHSPPLSKLLRELTGIARHASRTSSGEGVGVEIATSLLFVENALGSISRLPDNFAARADAMTARLLALVSGEQPADQAGWLDDISRQAQQRQTDTALAIEMQASLRQVEKLIEEYVNDPTQRALITQIGAILHQIEGAMAVLDQDEAMRAVQCTAAMLQRLTTAETAPERKEFEKIATNIGALGFFIETLQMSADAARKRFAFDAANSIFQARLIDKKGGETPLADVEAYADSLHSPPGDDATAAHLLRVEDELAVRQRQSAELAISLTRQPDNARLHEQLKESLEQISRDATLVDNPEAVEQARAAIELLDQPATDRGSDGLAILIAPPVPAADLAQTATAAPATDEEIDEELLGIFMLEAREVLATVRATVPQSRSKPYNEDHLTSLRRSFHTLKGSSRMVGLTAFGEIAWSVEQVLNLRLAEGRAGDANLYGLIDHVTAFLDGWIAGLERHGYSDRNPDALTAAARRVQAGEPFDVAEITAGGEDEISTNLPMQHAGPLPAAADGMARVEPEAVAGPSRPACPPASEEAPAATGNLPIPDTAEVAPVADVLEFPTLPQTTWADASHNMRQIGDLQISIPLHGIYLAETDELIRILAQDFGEWRLEPARPVHTQAVHAAHSVAGSSATVGFRPLQEIAQAIEAVLQYLVRRPVGLMAGEFDVLEQAIERAGFMLRLFALGEMPDREPEQVAALDRLLHALGMRENQPTAGLRDASAPATRDPDVPAGDNGANEAPPAIAHSAVSKDVFDAVLNAEALAVLRDDLDADLIPVFLEEGRDMLPQISEMLRAWQQRPEDRQLPHGLLRLLHTLKGSARMAGAMALGQHMHDMESRVEQVAAGTPSAHGFDELLMRHDLGLQMFELLQHPDATRHAMADAPVQSPVSPVPSPLPLPAQSGGDAAPTADRLPHSAAAPAPLVRVRADILDRLVTQAGEVSITRSRLETEVGSVRQSLLELNENLARLREQLREVEMQAESQITSRMTHTVDRDFDPLEFDRFTRLQELTRMMAESVNDVGSLQQSLNRTIDGATDDLAVQARLTRDLQQDLRRVRMVQFASIAERLFRVTRQVSKELNKRVNLDIHGGSVELDRGVLERMVGAFEHVLRNAIVHGIEPREARLAAGKSEIGELLVEVRQDGNEVVIRFSDDGQGLDLPGIRDKACALGLLPGDSNASAADIAELIFHPGFSTAGEVTELAGRGIGMDVVRSEAAALGGRVLLHSEPGKGAAFTIHLPLTLAVTQVVLISIGERIYAVPSVLVEQVQQLKIGGLTAAYNEGAVLWQGQRVTLHYLPALLGEADATPVAQQYSPILILKSGDDWAAVHVDQVIGNREVVVKNVGPQLARLIGIAGATVLGSGDIVLILDPVPLARRTAHENLRAPRLQASDAPQQMGAVAEVARSGDDGASVTPVQGLRTQHVVMVVDDSLTVRRVTQRLLIREGYQVVLAKDGVDALEHLQSHMPDVILLDIEMPRMDGFDLTRNIRGDERTRGIPIVMITSRIAAKHRRYALELGVNEYLGKPYQEAELLRLIAGFVGGRMPTV
jgi:chemosensory pili system protein ChpA (sensor histidine kinase/response regulator)